MKKILSLILLSLCILQVTKPVVLTHHTLKILDGSSIGLDGIAIYGIMSVVKKTTSIKTGKAGDLIKLYDYEGEKYSVKELVEVEQILLTEEKLENQSIEQLKEIKRKKHALTETLEKSKADFMEIVKPFIKGVQKTKHLVVLLLTESCEKRDRMGSIMMKWLSSHGNEEFVFKTSIHNFATYDVFLQQVTDFLLDLVESCPKGHAQFKKMIKNYKKNN